MLLRGLMHRMMTEHLVASHVVRSFYVVSLHGTTPHSLNKFSLLHFTLCSCTRLMWQTNLNSAQLVIRPRRESSSHAVRIRNNKWKRKKKKTKLLVCMLLQRGLNQFLRVMAFHHKWKKKICWFNLTVPVRVNHHHIVPRVFFLSSSFFSAFH